LGIQYKLLSKSNDMNTKLILTLILVFIITLLVAQVPTAFNYQGMARNEEGFAIANQMITIKISLISGSSQGAIVYQEEHTPKTNRFGIFNIRVGQGEMASSVFENIDWSRGNYFIRTSIDPEGGRSFIDFEATKLYSVPYALYAAESGKTGQSGDDQELVLDGSLLSIENGNSVDFSSLLVEPSDQQQLSLEGGILSIDNGNSIDLNTLHSQTEGYWQEDENGISYSGTSVGIVDSDGNKFFEVQDIQGLGPSMILSDTNNEGELIISSSGWDALDSEGNLTASFGSLSDLSTFTLYNQNKFIVDISEDFEGNGYITTYDNEENPLLSFEGTETHGSISVKGDNVNKIELKSEANGGSIIRLGDDSFNTSVEIEALETGGSINLYNEGIETVQLSTDQTNSTSNGRIDIYDEEGFDIVSLKRSTFGEGGALEINHRGSQIVNIQSNAADAGSLTTFNKSGDRVLSLSTQDNGRAGDVNLYSNNRRAIQLTSSNDGIGILTTYDSDENEIIRLEGSENNGRISILGDNVEKIELKSEDDGGSTFRLVNSNLNTSVEIRALERGGDLRLSNNGNETVRLSTEQTESTSNGKIEIFDEGGFAIASLNRSEFGDGGALEIKHGNSTVVHMESNTVDAGSIKTSSVSGDKMISLTTRDNGTAGHANVYRNDQKVVGLTSNIEGGGFVITYDIEEGVSNTIGTNERGEGYIGTHNDSIDFATYLSSIDSGEGFIKTKGSNGRDNVRLTTLLDHSNHGFISVQNSEGETQAGMYVDTDGKGVIFADEVNSFVENPKKSGDYHMFSTVQGPEQVYFIRGTSKLVNGKGEVDFPIYFQNVIAKSGMTVMMTPLSASSKGLSVIQKNISGFQVQELLEGKGNYEFDWEIKAVRKKSLKKNFGNMKKSKESIAKIPNLKTESIKE